LRIHLGVSWWGSIAALKKLDVEAMTASALMERAAEQSLIIKKY
jgi:hypothetical protein